MQHGAVVQGAEGLIASWHALMRSLILPLVLAGIIGGCHDPGPIERTEHRIGLQPLGEVPAAWLDSIRDAIETGFDLRVSVLPAREMPRMAYIEVKSPRYRADSLLTFLRQNRPDSLELIIGVTTYDISTTKRDANGKVLEPESRYSDRGVFGLGYLPGVACVISSFRLGDGHAKFIQRLRKVAVHEVGHNLGLPHCDSEGCVMRDAVEHVSTIDLDGDLPCEQCRSKLH